MRKRLLIACIVIIFLITAIIPLGNLSAEPPSNTILNGDFTSDDENQPPAIWHSAHSGITSGDIVFTENSNKRLKLFASKKGLVEIWQGPIPVTTDNLILNVDIMPVEMEDSPDLESGIYITYFIYDYEKSDYTYIGLKSRILHHSDLSINNWQTVSLNLNNGPASEEQWIEKTPGSGSYYNSSDARYISIAAGINSDSDTYGLTLLFDNFRLLPLASQKQLTPQEWAILDHNIGQLLEHYGTGPEGFIDMLYDNILMRAYDEEGKSYWAGMLENSTFTASQVAEHFIFSDEISAKIEAMSDEEFISFLYKSILSRTPDAAGYNEWKGFLAGSSKLDTLRAFLNSDEWAGICKMFGV